MRRGSTHWGSALPLLEIIMEYTYTLTDGRLDLIALNEGRPERADDGAADGLGLTAVELVAQAFLRHVRASISADDWDSVSARHCGIEDVCDGNQCMIDAMDDTGHGHLIDLDLWDNDGMPDSTMRLIDDAWNIALTAIYTHRASL